MPRQLINDYLKEKEEQLTIWALGGHMYLAIASCILYVKKWLLPIWQSQDLSYSKNNNETF
jgi:hypothetical protein